MNESDRSKTIRCIVIFSVLTLAVAWIGSLLGGDPVSPGLGFLVWGTAPMVVSLVMRTVTRDWSDLGARPAIGRNLGWYAVSLVAFPVAITLALVLGSVVSASSVSWHALATFLETAPPAIGIVSFALLFALFEEVGWRGYLAPKLSSLGINAFLAHALVAVVWASWHLPYIHDFSTYTSEGLVTFIPRFYLGVFAFSIVYGEIRMLTTTFWPAVLMHWVGNAIANILVVAFVSLSVGREYLGSIGVDGVFMIVLFGLLGVAIHGWRRRKMASAGSLA